MILEYIYGTFIIFACIAGVYTVRKVILGPARLIGVVKVPIKYNDEESEREELAPERLALRELVLTTPAWDEHLLEVKSIHRRAIERRSWAAYTMHYAKLETASTQKTDFDELKKRLAKVEDELRRIKMKQMSMESGQFEDTEVASFAMSRRKPTLEPVN